MTAHNTTLKRRPRPMRPVTATPPNQAISARPVGQPSRKTEGPTFTRSDPARGSRAAGQNQDRRRVSTYRRTRAILRSLMDAAARGNVAAARFTCFALSRPRLRWGVAPEAEQAADRRGTRNLESLLARLRENSYDPRH